MMILRMLVFFAATVCVPVTAQEFFHNPILAGFFPDPSICRVGRDYYLVTSTFSYFPGLPVLHSTDLVNWSQIGSVLSRPGQMNLEGQGVSRGLFAPSIRHNGKLFYVTCTMVDLGGNFIATAEDPAGPWSDPIWVPEVNGIDPSMYFDEDGKAYILYNSIPPDNKPRYDGHRTIRMYEFDLESMKVKGQERILVNGGSDISKEPDWIEAPHIFRKDGYYYLICAEGGTADNHSEVVFRSKDVWGPYEPYGGNPILTQRHLEIPRRYPVTTAGHADFVETPSGDWWAVFLACRPYRLDSPQEEYYNTGRETWLAPVAWKDGWPLIDIGGPTIQYRYSRPRLKPGPEPRIPLSGNFTYRDEFDEDELRMNWMFLRTPLEPWFSLENGILSMDLRPETASGLRNPSFLGHRQQHLRGSAAAAVNVTPNGENERAGLLVFQSEGHYYLLCKSVDDGTPAVQLFKSAEGDSGGTGMSLLASSVLPLEGTVSLKIVARGDTYAFWYAIEPTRWTLLKEGVDATFLNSRYPHGFVGCMYALYATSTGKPSDAVAEFEWFEYVGNDEMYR